MPQMMSNDGFVLRVEIAQTAEAMVGLGFGPSV